MTSSGKREFDSMRASVEGPIPRADGRSPSGVGERPAVVGTFTVVGPSSGPLPPLGLGTSDVAA
eukprot:6263257-Prymnesium_polylepis.1